MKFGTKKYIPKKNPESNRMTWNINKQSHNKEKLSGKS